MDTNNANVFENLSKLIIDDNIVLDMSSKKYYRVVIYFYENFISNNKYLIGTKTVWGSINDISYTMNNTNTNPAILSITMDNSRYLNGRLDTVNISQSYIDNTKATIIEFYEGIESDYSTHDKPDIIWTLLKKMKIKNILTNITNIERTIATKENTEIYVDDIVLVTITDNIELLEPDHIKMAGKTIKARIKDIDGSISNTTIVTLDSILGLDSSDNFKYNILQIQGSEIKSISLYKE